MSLGEEFQDLKSSIQTLDKKVDDLQKNTGKQMEKMESSISKLADSSAQAINKLTETITNIQLLLAKDYICKEDLDKIELELKNDIYNIEVSLTEKININNTNRKNEIKELNSKITEIKNNSNINVVEVIRNIIYAILISGGTYLFTR